MASYARCTCRPIVCFSVKRELTFTFRETWHFV